MRDGVLEFLVFVEEDEKLNSWARKELKSTEQRIKTKEELYKEAIAMVARLANQDKAIDSQLEDYRRFWSLYNEELLPVESREVEAVMVAIGRELRLLSAGAKRRVLGYRILPSTLPRQ